MSKHEQTIRQAASSRNLPALPMSAWPTTAQLEAEVRRVRYRSRFGRVMRSTLYTLITVAAIAVLVATLWLPVLQIYGSSMTPSLEEGEIVVALKDSEFETGDVIAFYYNNKMLVKRVIATAGQWVDMDDDGNVYIDGKQLDEPYLTEKAYGDCDIKLPYQVPESRVFVMGDHRATSVDSRNTVLGCVADEQVVGRIVFCVWPLDKLGLIQ